jgi:outer membrane receptor protein involved in Fe transport
MSFKNRSLSQSIIWSALLVTISLGQVMVAQAQQLEEIIVTAQRREQSLQDVPISLQTFQADDMSRNGFDSLSELSTFAPGLVIKDGSEEQGLILRGSGTQSKNLGIEQGVPTFIDGIHRGRGSMVIILYMDIERVEVLKGPQPVFFGQNAAAGALNIATKKPGAEWEGSLAGEFGNFGKKTVEAAFGGPVTDTFGIRVAAKYYELEGWMEDFFTGDKFPQRKSTSFRITTQWQPTDNFEATFKVEVSDNDHGPRVSPIVLDRYSGDQAYSKTAFTGGFFRPHAERIGVTGIASTNRAPASLTQGIGEVTNLGYKYGPRFLDPRAEVIASGIPITEASGSDSGAVFDFTECFRNGGLEVMETGGIAPTRPSHFESCNMSDESGSKPWHAIMDLKYTLGSGVEMASKTGYSRQNFYNTPHNSGGGAFATNPRSRGEFFGQWSQELRLSSAAGGSIEWMGGVYWQKNALEAWSDANRANSRNPLRWTRTQDDSTWMSAFATVTLNFFDNKASLDLGGRYTDVNKEGIGVNRVGEFYVRDEIEAGGDGNVYRLPYGADATTGSSRGTRYRAFLAAHPGLVNGSVVGRSRVSENCDQLTRLDDVIGIDDGVNPVWLNMGNLSGSRCATVESTVDKSKFNPQIVMRYRPSDNLSTYFKYATSFKSGAFDMGVSSVPGNSDDFTFGPEEYEVFELGARGTFMDGRVQAEATIYTTDITGVQVSFVDRFRDFRNVTRNIAAQTSKGIELSGKFAATERMTLSGYLALMDATIDSFPDAVCTSDEVVVGICRTEAESIALVGDDSLEGTADRSGATARNAPDWQYTGNLRYEMPTILDGYYSNLDFTFVASDDYTTDRSFSTEVFQDAFVDANISVEIGGVDERWSLLLYGRNLFAPKPSYTPDVDTAGDGLLGSSIQLGTNNFVNYGARLRFNFF